MLVCVCGGWGWSAWDTGVGEPGRTWEIECFNRFSQVKSHVTQAVRLVKGVVLRRSVVNNTDAWETRSAFVSYPVTAAPSDSSSLALGLGLGLGLLAFGTVVAIMVMRRRAASQRAVFAMGNNMQLHLVASAE